MVIDVHTHIFPDKICADRNAFLKDEPAFELLYKDPKSKMVTAPEMIAAMDQNQVDKAVVFGFPWNNPNTIKMNNDYVVESVKQNPDRLIGLCCLNPYNDDYVDEAARCLESGVSGLGELAFYQSGIDEQALKRLEPLMKLCREKHAPVLIHTNEPVGHMYPGKSPISVKQIYDLAQTFSENIIILAHWGGGVFFYNLLKKEAKQVLQNVYLDTAASPYLYDKTIYRIAIDILGKEKVLFGSDYPLLPPSRYFKEMKEIGLSGDEIDAICGENTHKLFSGLSSNG